MRIDRFATLYFTYPIIQKVQRGHKVNIPILMYHSISEKEENKVHPYYQLNTTPEIFSSHMKFLQDNNYNVINLEDISNDLNQNQRKTNKYVIITFDDGFQDFYTDAFPTLQKYNFKATVFLATSFIEKSFKNKKCLTWDQIHELSNNGIIFGSHTVTHPPLQILKKDKIEDEIKRSKEIIEDRIGTSINSFSYPYAFPEEDKEFKTFIKYIIEKSGYKYCVTTIVGTSDKARGDFLKRIPVNSRDDIKFFNAKLNRAYDWVHVLQHFSKLLSKLTILMILLI